MPLCTIVVHNTAQSSSDNIPPLPPDNHHSSDAVYRRRGGGQNQRNSSGASVKPATSVCFGPAVRDGRCRRPAAGSRKFPAYSPGSATLFHFVVVCGDNKSDCAPGTNQVCLSPCEPTIAGKVRHSAVVRIGDGNQQPRFADERLLHPRVKSRDSSPSL